MKEDQDGDDISPFSIGDKNETSDVDGGHKRRSTRTRIPRGQFPNFAQSARARICIGAVDAAQPGRRPRGCSRSFSVHSLTHTQTKDHLGQISPADARGVRGRVTPGMLNISSPLFSSSLLLPHLMLPPEYWRGVGCGMSARESASQRRGRRT